MKQKVEKRNEKKKTHQQTIAMQPTTVNSHPHEIQQTEFFFFTELELKLSKIYTSFDDKEQQQQLQPQKQQQVHSTAINISKHLKRNDFLL